jgi:SpoVK/Ycf46/Vps4 family AAA+-type ATPase
MHHRTVMAEWCHQPTLKQLCALLHAWASEDAKWNRVEQTTPVALVPQPFHCVCVDGPPASGKRALIDAALADLTATEEHVDVEIADCAQYLADEGVCGPSKLVDEGRTADVCVAEANGFRRLLRAESVGGRRRVVVLERLDLYFPAPPTGGGGEDTSAATEDGDTGPSLLLTCGANAGHGSVTALVSLASELLTLPQSVFVIISTDKGDLHPLLERCAAVKLSIRGPDANTRRQFALRQLRSMAPNLDARVAEEFAAALAERTGGGTFDQLRAYIRDAVRHRPLLTSATPPTSQECHGTVGDILRDHGGGGFTGADRVLWDAIVGLDDVKAALKAAAGALTARATATDDCGLVRGCTGFLLYGVPGTGKTMLAKALATEAGATFLTAAVPELVESAVGESERKVRTLFAEARRRAPCVVFLDEVQAAFGRRGAGADNSRLHERRLLATLLAELDECRDHRRRGNAGVLVVAATNVPQLLDDALLAPGRLEQHIHVPPPPLAAACLLVAKHLQQWGWKAGGGSSGANLPNRGDTLLQAAAGVLQSGGMRRLGALWTSADVATMMNLLGVDAVSELAAASPEGRLDLSAYWNAPAADGEAILRRAVSRIEPSGSEAALRALNTWRAAARCA